MKLLIGLICLPILSFAGLKYHSENLKIMDIESIQRIVERNLAAAQKASGGVSDEEESSQFNQNPTDQYYSKDEARDLLKTSIELVFARPDQDGATSQVFSSISSVAENYGGIANLLDEVTSDAIAVLDKDDREPKDLLRAQNTYIYILNNMMQEIKPLVEDGDPGMKKLVEKIRDADIDFSDALKSHRLLNSMKNITNPSKLAQTIIGKKESPWWKFW